MGVRNRWTYEIEGDRKQKSLWEETTKKMDMTYVDTLDCNWYHHSTARMWSKPKQKQAWTFKTNVLYRIYNISLMLRTKDSERLKIVFALWYQSVRHLLLPNESRTLFKVFDQAMYLCSMFTGHFEVTWWSALTASIKLVGCSIIVAAARQMLTSNLTFQRPYD